MSLATGCNRAQPGETGTGATGAMGGASSLVLMGKSHCNRAQPVHPIGCYATNGDPRNLPYPACSLPLGGCALVGCDDPTGLLLR